MSDNAFKWIVIWLLAATFVNTFDSRIYQRKIADGIEQILRK